MKYCDSQTRSIVSRISERIPAYCAFRSSNGTLSVERHRLFSLRVVLSTIDAGTGSLVAAESDSIPADAHPRDHPPGVPDDERVIGDVTDDHRASADKSVASDRDSADDGGI